MTMNSTSAANVPASAPSAPVKSKKSRKSPSLSREQRSVPVASLLWTPDRDMGEGSVTQKPSDDGQSYEALLASVKLVGVETPILVKPQGEKFKVIAGRRRARAASEAGMTDIMAVVVSGDVDDELAAFRENMVRKSLTVFEKLTKIFSLSQRMSPSEVASHSGLSESFVRSCIRVMMNCPPEAIEAIKSGKLKLDKAFKIAAVKDRAKQLDMLDTDESKASVEPSKEPSERSKRISKKNVDALSSSLMQEFSLDASLMFATEVIVSRLHEGDLEKLASIIRAAIKADHAASELS